MEIKDWLSINKIEGEGSQKVTLTTPQNDGEDRTAKLVVRNGNKNVLVNVRQLKKSGSFKWYYKSNKPIPQGGATTNDVLGIFTSTAPCTLIRADIYLNTELGMGFVQEETLEMNEGTDYIILNAESNNKEGETQPIRFVQYLVIYEGVNYGVINIPQQGATPSFSVEPNEIEFHKEGGSKTVKITSNTNWLLWYENRQNEHHHSKNVGTSGTTTVTIYADEYNGVEEIVSNIRIGIPYYDQFSVPLVVRQDSLDLPQDCFYIEPIDNEVRIGIGFRTYSANMNTNILPKMSFQYYQNGEWKTYNGYDYGTLNYFKENMLVITEKTFIKNFDKWSGGFSNGTTEIKLGTLAIDGYCNIGGDITTLLGEMRYNYAYALFSTLIQPSSNVNLFYLTPSIINAKDLILSPKITTNGAYASMFYGQRELLTPPIIKAEDSNSSYINVDTSWDYYYMFYECNLTKAPIINVQGLRNKMVEGIFNSCNNINEITILGNLAPNFDILEGYVYDDNDKLGVNGGIYYKSSYAPTPIVPSNWEVRDYEGDL